MDEDDPVVQEIPVYLSQALGKSLHLYQFPMRPGSRDWHEVNVTNAAIKPNNQLVRLEVGLDTYSEKYSSSKGEQIALNTDGQAPSRFSKDKEREKSIYFRNGIMDKIVYESCTPCADSSNYAVAILQDKELHCTPVQGIVQLRPSFAYYDKQDKRKHENNKHDASDEEEAEAEALQVTVKFARQETEVAKKAREKSFETLTQRVAEERWYDSSWRHSNTDHAELERLKLFSAVSSMGSALSLRGRQYIRALVPAADDDSNFDSAESSTISTPISSTTSSVTISNQIQQVLANAKLMSLSEIMLALRCSNEASVVRSLSAVACCVRGLWTPRSDHLYTRDDVVPARLMCAARDHLLYLFTHHRFVDRRKMTAACRLPARRVLEVIHSVAKYHPNTGWELLLPPDTDFETKYPEIVERQNAYWEARQRQFNEMSIGESVPRRQRKKSQRESFSSDTMMSPKQRCNSVTTMCDDDSDRKRPKNKTNTGGGKRTRNFSSSSAHDG